VEPIEVGAIRAAAQPVTDGVPADEALFDLVGDARFVLIGEASHGTQEFYAARATMTRRLIEEKGFRGVAVEADWPDAYRVNRYVRGRSDDRTAEEALRGFERFPTWMWRNTPVLDFVHWLRTWNNGRRGGEAAQAGFYGLDVYSLYRSIDEIISYLDRIDPAAADRARERYACLDHADSGAGRDGQAYGMAAAFGTGDTCEQEIIDQLVDLSRHAIEYSSGDSPAADEEFFSAEQNARTVQAAAGYYRTMFTGRPSSWNLRDQHMVDTMDALAEHLSRPGSGAPRIVVWAHNSHVGDARATEMGARGEWNIGQLVRERHPDECVLIGLTTYRGTVTAADDWDSPADRKQVRPALVDSVEELLHDTGRENFFIPLRSAPQAAEALAIPRLQRAIGVIYRPETERQSHYFRTRTTAQLDGLIHIDQTRAVEPLERTQRWELGEAPETYPFNV
jgi:erythromycin esterase-like protein